MPDCLGVMFDPEQSDCQKCKEAFPNDYDACGEAMGQEPVIEQEELDVVAEEHEAESEQGDFDESPDDVPDEVPDEKEEPDDAAIESIEEESPVKRGRPPIRLRAFIAVLNTGEQFPTVGTIIGVGLLLFILIALLVFALGKMARMGPGTGGNFG